MSDEGERDAGDAEGNVMVRREAAQAVIASWLEFCAFVKLCLANLRRSMS